MAITLDEIRSWAVSRGIGHINMESDGLFTYTACRSWGTFALTTNRPSRICKKCRAALRNLRRHPDREEKPAC